MSGGKAGLYPLFLKLGGRTVLVVGAGAVAERKIASLLEAGARVRVVSPTATAKVQKLAQEAVIEWIARPFAESDADGAWLVIAATADDAVQQSAAAAAEARKIFAVAVDDPPNASAYSAAVVVRPPFTIAISSSGALPAVTRLLRELIEDLLPADDWVDRARALRAQWMAENTPATDRFGDLVRQFAAKRG
jgi:siroheme synthase-like protein